jgi:hypothetical protein
MNNLPPAFFHKIVTVRKYGDLERNWLRGLVTSLGQQPSTHARTHARTMKALNLRARRNYIPFVCLFVCLFATDVARVLTPLVTVALRPPRATR